MNDIPSLAKDSLAKQRLDNPRMVGYNIYHGRRVKFRATTQHRHVNKWGARKLGTSAVDTGFDDVEYFDGDVSNTPVSDPETDLWVACLGQVIEDATIPDDIVSRPRKGGDNPALIRSRARAYVFAKVGSTAQDFTEVCLLANFEPEFIRDCVTRMIDEHKSVSREQITGALRPKNEAGNDE